MLDKKQQIINTFLASLENVDEKTFEEVEILSKKEAERKKRLKELADSYFLKEYLYGKDIDEKLLKVYKRLGYYQLIKDCIALLQEDDENIKLGFGCITKEGD